MDNETGKGSEIEDAFFSDGYQLAKEFVGTEISNKSLYRGVKKLYKSIDYFIELFLEATEQGGISSACRKGCSWCCSQAVYAQTHEIGYLLNWSKLYLRETELNIISQRGSEKCKNTTELGKEERALHKEECPYLFNNECIVYEARPLACRIYLSFNLDSCINEFMHPEDENHYPKLFDFPLKAGRKLNEGFVQWLTEQGLTILEYPLEDGVTKSG